MTAKDILIPFIAIVFGLIMGFGLGKRDSTHDFWKMTTNYQETINKIEYCVQSFNGYQWYFKDNELLCFDKEGKLTMKNDTGAM